jgi:hypothetical protein
MDCGVKEVVISTRLRCNNYVQAKSRQTQDARSSMFSFSSHMDMAMLCDARDRDEKVSERMTWYVGDLGSGMVSITAFYGRRFVSITMFSVSSHRAMLTFSALCDGRTVENRCQSEL